MEKVARYSLAGTVSSGSYGGACKVAATEDCDQFPAGMRVLVVDDDVLCLRILEQMLRRCSYHVTTCSQATVALNLLRERKGCFDVVLSDVYMPDMDGFKLLEHVGLEMDLPVIMMSADGSTSAVMKGIRHGACDYLIKPVREEELKNIWQHVVRKRWNGSKETDQSCSFEDNDRHKRGSDVDYASSVNEETEGMLKTQKKRSNATEEDDSELENDDLGTSKKPRVVWSVELHHQFVNAVNQLGIDKAVPKRILELMNVPGLTRENVASHLQKFRLYLKRLNISHQQGGISNSFCGPVESSKLDPLGGFDIQALTAASGQIPSQTLIALRAGLLGRSTGNVLLPTIDQQASFQGSKGILVENGIPFGQHLMRSQSNTSMHFPHSAVSVDDVPSGFGAWPSNTFGTMGPNSNLGVSSSQNSDMLMDILQQQRQYQQKQQQESMLLPDPSRSISVQPSCLVVPSQSSESFQGVHSSTSVNHNCNFNRSSMGDYRLPTPQPNNSLSSIGQISDVDIKPSVLLKGYLGPSHVSSSVSSCYVNADNIKQFPELPSNACDIRGFYGAKPADNLDQGPRRNLGFVGKGTYIPSRFAVNELESQMSNLNPGKIYMEDNGVKVKQEPNLDFTENAKVVIPILQHYSPNDLMSVLSE